MKFFMILLYYYKNLKMENINDNNQPTNLFNTLKYKIKFI